jgi:HEAT repeat protein
MKWVWSVCAALLCLAASARGEGVEGLIKQLKDPEASTRRAAAKALAEAGPNAKDAVGALADALKDNDSFVRRFAAQALGEIGPAAKDAVPALSKALNDGRREVQEAAAAALGKIGPSSAQALVAVVKDTRKDAMVRRKAVESLAALGAEGRPALPGLVELIANKPARGSKKRPAPDIEIRVEAVNALGQIAGPDDKAAIDALTALTDPKQNNNRALRQAVNVALRKIKNNSK